MEVGITINEERMKSAAYLIGKGTVEFPEQFELDLSVDVHTALRLTPEKYADLMIEKLSKDDRDEYFREFFVSNYHFIMRLEEAYERERLHRILNSGDTERILFELGLGVDEEE